VPGTNDAKREFRRTMRMVRRQAASDPGRSAALADRLAAMPEVQRAGTVMLFDPMPGEPDLGPLAVRLRERGVTVVVPAPERMAPWPIAPGHVDVVVVPGLAFTPDGHRLGQGAGWYDRFLAEVRPNCTGIGVCFDEQLVDAVPTEPHDLRVRWVVTPTQTVGTGREPGRRDGR
jgi:5-formyltetrahydrofolate cyclo-ligase